MHILITRPEPDASEMRELLEREGHTADVAPLLEIAVSRPDAAQLESASALVVTSRNGLRSLEGLTLSTTILARPMLVVGKATGAAARELGFTDVTVGPATAKDLVPLIIAAWRDKILPATQRAPGPVLHLSGDKISFDLVPPLKEAAVPLVRETVYRSQPATRLPGDVRDRLARSGYDAIVLMSPLTADTFVDLVADPALADGVRHAAYLCFSNGIAERIGPLAAQRIHVADRPNIEEMLALIRRMAERSAHDAAPDSASGNSR